MLHFEMNMPFILMSFYGSVMILVVLLFRTLLKKKLPKFVFPVIWCVILLRLLIPFSVSSPLTIRLSDDSPLSALTGFLTTWTDTATITADAEIIEDTEYAYTEKAIENVTLSTKPAIIEVSSDHSALYDIINFLHLPFMRGHTFLLLIYVIGFVLTAGILLWQRYLYSKKLHSSLLVEHNETINELLREMNMGHILVYTNDEIASPLTCGLLAPRIYLPTRMDFQSRELLRHILLHETMHIKRKDNWVKVFMLAALVINWFNPLVWLMSKCFVSDLESACDEAVLKHCSDEDERKSYALNLLAMAITGNRSTLLYSAFSKTEVEKRIQSILHYKKASFLLLTIALCFMTCNTVAFATCAQAPFSPYLTSSCASDSSRFGVKVYTTRSLTLGQDAQMRAEDIIFDVLDKNTDNDPSHINEEILAALSDEFHVEKSAFRTDIFLCLSDEEKEKEYAAWDLSMDQDGIRYYKGDPIRVFNDEMGGTFYSYWEGTVDVTIVRDRFGLIADVRARREVDGARP